MSRATWLPARLALRLGLLAVTVSLIQTVWAASSERARGEAALRERAQRVAARLAVALQAPLYSFDGATVGDVVAAELAAPEVAAVHLAGSSVDRTWHGTAGGERAGAGLVTATATVMEPPSVPAARPLGTVTVQLSPHLLAAEWRALVWRRALETLALAGTIVLVGWAVMHRNVVRPLERVRAAMNEARQALAGEAGTALPAADPVAGVPGAFPELRAMGADYHRLAEAVQQSRATLAEREADLRATLDSIGDAVVTTDPAGRVAAMNPVAERLTGVPAAEALGRPLAEVLAPRGLADGGLGGLVAAVLARGASWSPPDPLPFRDRAGLERWVTLTAAPVRRQGGEAVGVVVSFRDVSAQRSLEEQVRQAHKLEAIGQLAGGVAHDFNNMLTPLLAYGQLIREAPEASEEIREHAGVVVETAARAAALTRQLLAFSRKGGRTRRPLDPGKAVEETAALLRRTLDRTIEVQLDLRATRPVLGDGALVQNSLLNLCLNARDAMPRGGVLRLATRDAWLAEEDCAVPGFSLSPGPHVELSVSDTGLGMAPEVLARIFEPFFTTKEAGKGTGLGLAAVHGATTEHGGAVLVDSVPGTGTTFRLLFPAAAVDEVERTPAAAPPRQARSGRVLVVEDEPRIRELVVRTLGTYGLRADVAADGEEALAALAGPTPYQLVVLDMVLPRLGGHAVFTSLRARRPGLPVLITSGFARDERLVELLEEEGVAFLEKPWRPSQLLDEVDRLLG